MSFSIVLKSEEGIFLFRLLLFVYVCVVLFVGWLCVLGNFLSIYNFISFVMIFIVAVCHGYVERQL